MGWGGGSLAGVRLGLENGGEVIVSRGGYRGNARGFQIRIGAQSVPKNVGTPWLFLEPPGEGSRGFQRVPGVPSGSIGFQGFLASV